MPVPLLVAFRLTPRENADLLRAPLRILLVIAVAVAVRLVAGRAIDRLARSTSDGRVGQRLSALGARAPRLVDPSPPAMARRRARADTVASVLRSVLNTVLLAVVVITILGELGVDLAPILASAGIIGVAVGFGSQNLVRDFLSGLFLILEDQFGVGDVIDAGPAVGTVEAVGLRSTHIRDLHGTLWHIRNGTITRIGNFSQAWNRVVLDITVPVGTDIAAATRVLTEAATAVAADPAYAEAVLEAPSVAGVVSFAATGVTLRVSLRRHAGQDAVDRALRERVLADCAAAGVPLGTAPTLVSLLPAPPPAGEADG